MRLRSFRVRIALLSAALSGLVLSAFAIWVWLVVSRASLDRIDRDIRDRAAPHLFAPYDREHWHEFQRALQFIYGEKERGSVILLVRGRTGEVLSVSPHWPQELSTREFPPPNPADPAFRPPPPPPAGQPGRPGPPPRLPPLPLKPPVFLTRRVGHDRWRIGVMANPEVTLMMGMRLDAFTAEAQRTRTALLMALPAALLLIGAAAWLVAQRALRPVRKLAFAAEGITAKGLDQRIAATDADSEFVRLITVFNRMMDRLEGSFNQAVRFSADAAHELKTPLTILQGELEQALQSSRPGSEEQTVYNELLEEVQRLKEIVRKLLLLSLADAGKLELHPEPLNLSEAVENVCEDLEIEAPGLTVKHGLDPDVWVNADADLVSQVLRNLTTNAVKYNREGGSMELRLRRAGSMARLTVANTGDGIPPADRDRIFERFYRADRSRGRKVDGVGLGLSLAREIVRAHGGSLVLEDSRADTTVFAMTLPLSDGAPDPAQDRLSSAANPPKP